MTNLFPYYDRLMYFMLWVGLAMAVLAMGAIVIERVAAGYWFGRRRRIEQRYAPLVDRALADDATAERVLVGAPRRHRLIIAALLIIPLIEDRSPDRITKTRAIVRAMSIVPIADAYARSWRWWRRALAIRVFGLLQMRDRTAQVVAALDDTNRDVRGAALDALADLKDPASLKAIIVRLHDSSLHRGRRVQALTAFGRDSERFLLELGSVDPANRLNYARALALIGTEAARPTLCRWTLDTRVEVRAAAFEALTHVGLDDRAAALAIDALKNRDQSVRAMAAEALCGWTGAGDAASHLADHLADTWIVAVRAARSLQSMGPAGLVKLQESATRPDVAGLLARQMLWEHAQQC
jgi:FOG: HEAT repeat